MTSTSTPVRTLNLPASGGGTREITLNNPAALVTSPRPAASRIAYAAGHVVADAAISSAGDPTAIDWDATMAIRHSIWKLGLGVAECMDTAQRGMGLDAATALELARRTLAEAATVGGAVVVGVTSDALGTGEYTLEEITNAYVQQLAQIEAVGGTAVLMASRHLVQTATNAADYLKVYRAVLESANNPVILHWLGAMFDPALEGYWGSVLIPECTETVLKLIGGHAEKVAGIKISLLDADHEVAFRRRLPSGVRLFTGDDFNYVDLIAGDELGHSDALLGAFSAVPRFASAALARLDAGDIQGFRDILEPTVPLSRLIFEAPTQYYKVGIVFLAYLNGQQDHFRMIGGLESGRSLAHLAEVFELANSIGLFENPVAAAARAEAFFGAQGF